MDEELSEMQRRALSRVRRAHTWLGVVLFLHGTAAAFVVAAVVGGSIEPTGVAVAAVALVAAPLILNFWWERREPIARRPARWMRRGTAVVALHAVGTGIAVCAAIERGSHLEWHRVGLFALLTFAIETGGIWLASRALRSPLTAELGMIDFEVRAAIRSPAPWSPGWLANDDVRLTSDSVTITLRPGPNWAFVEQIPLGDIVDADVRQWKAEDGPWFEVEGKMYWPSHGDVVVINHRRGTRLLPVHDAAGFASVLRVRLTQAIEHDADGPPPTAETAS